MTRVANVLLFIEISYLLLIMSWLIVVTEKHGLKYGMYIAIGYIMTYLHFIFKKLY